MTIELIHCVHCAAPVTTAVCDPDPIPPPRGETLWRAVVRYVCPSCRSACSEALSVDYDPTEPVN